MKRLRVFVYAAGVAVFSNLLHLIRTSETSERAGLIAALIMQQNRVRQMSTSLALFALRNVDWDFSNFGTHLWTWSPASFKH